MSLKSVEKADLGRVPAPHKVLSGNSSRLLQSWFPIYPGSNDRTYLTGQQ